MADSVNPLLDNANAPPAAEEGPSKSALKRAEKQARMAAEKAEKKASQGAKALQKAVPVVGGKKADDIIGITSSKETDFSSWYQEVVLKAEMIEYYNEIAGFFILRPASMYIWKVIHSKLYVISLFRLELNSIRVV